MHADNVSLFALLDGAKQFQVPTYQRAFCWKERQVSQLWADIRNEAARLLGGQHAGHFLGSLVLAQADDFGPGGLQKWLVVDGQQRLTTLMLALAAIRDHIGPSDPSMAEWIHESLLTNPAYGDDRRFKLLPTRNDRPSYRAVVSRTQHVSAGDDKIVVAYGLLRKWMSELDDQPARVELTAIVETIKNKLDLVQIVSSRSDNAHRIFQTLNSTGTPLTQTDLIRNHLFMRLPNSIDQVYHDVWVPMQKRIGDEGIETLLWIDLILRGQDDAPQSEVFRLQVERFEKLDGEKAIAAELVELAHRARHYQLIIEPEREIDPYLRERLVRLKEWGAVTTYPAIMLLLKLREQQRISAAEAQDALLLVESFCVRRAIAGIPSNNLGRIFNAVPRELRGSDQVKKDLHKYLSAPKRLWPDDTRLAEAIQTHAFYLSSRGPQRAYILRRLEETYQSKEKVDWNSPVPYTIEHVMPRSLTTEWKTSLAAEADRFGITVHELHKLVVHTLGNLTLTGFNAELSNHSFEKKRERLRKSKLSMNHEISDNHRWDGLKISKRGHKLMEKAAVLWPSPLISNGSGMGRDWSRLHKALLLIPAGRWTTFGDLAEAVDSHHVPVGSHLGLHLVENSWRVLLGDGKPSPQLAAVTGGSQRERLAKEGVTFGPKGSASPGQRMSAKEIIVLMGEAID